VTEISDPPRPAPAPLTHRQIVEVVLGLVAMVFTAMVSSTIVSTALPSIIAALDGSQRAYTWVFTASLLAMTVTTPLWGKLSDLFDKKKVLQLAGVVFLVGSLWAGLARGVPELLAARALQGLGVGGLVALTQSVMGAIISPRERGRYNGYLASAMAVSTIAGPLIGGLLVDAVGWRWCFFATVPFSVLGLVMIQRFLKLEPLRRETRIDWWGALFISAAAGLPLVWVSFAGKDFPWFSGASALFLAGTLAALVLSVLVERRHPEPVVPPRVILERTTLLAVVASVAVGITQFGGSVFLSQYFQIARGFSPTAAGLLMLPAMLGNLAGSIVSGRLITRTGVWKRYLLLGAVLLVAGLGLMGTLDHATPVWLAGVYMTLMGVGNGMLMQNLVLVVQNAVDLRDVGTASAVVTFFRSLGGTMGITVLGAVLAVQAADRVRDGLAAAGLAGQARPDGLDLSGLSGQALSVVRDAHADAIGVVFLATAALGVASLLAVCLMPERELRTTVARTAKSPEKS